MEPLEIGEAVFLKGARTQMHIAHIEGDTAYCKWQIGGKPYRESYPLAALVRTSEYRPNWGPRIVKTF